MIVNQFLLGMLRCSSQQDLYRIRQNIQGGKHTVFAIFTQLQMFYVKLVISIHYHYGESFPVSIHFLKSYVLPYTVYAQIFDSGKF